MAKIKNLSPNLKVRNADVELALPDNFQSIGQSVGGISAFSQVFKRGYGENVFGVDDRGVWLGGADFDTAIVQQTFDGTITIWDRGVTPNLARVLIGYQLNGF